MSNSRGTCWNLGSVSTNDFKPSQGIRYGAKRRTVGSAWTQAKRPRTPFFHVRTTAPKAKPEDFLHQIMTGDEKWIQYDNPKHRKSWGKPGHASTSTAKPSIHGKKLMLCIWWDQLEVIYYELLQPNETITAERYRQQLMQLSRTLKLKRPQYTKRHDKVIFQHDNARPHVAKVVKDTLEALNWDVLPHPPYSPDIAPSDYLLFRSMAHVLSDSTSLLTKIWKIGSILGSPQKMRNFLNAVSVCCLKDGQRL